jgi:outer membrane protein TolC
MKPILLFAMLALCAGVLAQTPPVSPPGQNPAGQPTAQLQSLKSSVDLSVENPRLTRLRYTAGESTAQEVVDAQAGLVTARNAYDEGLVRYRLALANVQTLTGTF